jgi:hypothetical protein
VTECDGTNHLTMHVISAGRTQQIPILKMTRDLKTAPREFGHRDLCFRLPDRRTDRHVLRRRKGGEIGKNSQRKAEISLFHTTRPATGV